MEQPVDDFSSPEDDNKAQPPAPVAAARHSSSSSLMDIRREAPPDLQRTTSVLRTKLGVCHDWEPPLAIEKLSDDKIHRAWIDSIQHLLTLGRQANKPVNILVYGKSGNGKSSLINTILTIFQSSTQTRKFAVVRATSNLAASKGHVTRHYTRYSLLDSQISIWDIWGVDTDKNNFSLQFLSDLLEGNVKPDAEEGKLDAASQDSQGHSKINVVILCARAADVSSYLETSEEAIKLQEHVRHIQKSGVPVIGAITQMDKVMEMEGIPLRRMYWKAMEIDKEDYLCLAKRMQYLGIQPTSVFPLCSYTKERTRNKLIEVHILIMLLAAIGGARA